MVNNLSFVKKSRENEQIKIKNQLKSILGKGFSFKGLNLVENRFKHSQTMDKQGMSINKIPVSIEISSHRTYDNSVTEKTSNTYNSVQPSQNYIKNSSN